MHWILITAMYLVNPGERTDINIDIYPRTFDTVRECQFFADELIANQSERKRYYDAKCYGVSK